MCLVFDHDDAGYLDWLAKNQGGFVLNCIINGKRKLHRANCPFITNAKSHQHLTVNGIKVCASQTTPLDNRCTERDEAVPDRCDFCTPPKVDTGSPASRDQTATPAGWSAVQERTEGHAKLEPKTRMTPPRGDEDQLKKTLKGYLESRGWTVKDRKSVV